jgi:hypothetical protein
MILPLSMPKIADSIRQNTQSLSASLLQVNADQRFYGSFRRITGKFVAESLVFEYPKN